jgi:Ribbon-helix-helix domain
MPEPGITRLSITWSKDTDLALRSYLGARGLKKGALSKFIEDAVKWRLFDQTVHEVRQAFADVPADELDNMIEEAVDSIRKQKHRKRRGRGEK